MKSVIICGGVGTKMWPMSRQSHPKHFLPLINGKSLFQINYEVLRKKYQPKDIWVATIATHVEMAKSQVPEIPAENYSIEPELKNHGPGTGLAAANLYRVVPDEPFMLVQADVIRQPEEKFLEMTELIEKLCLSTDKYITGGFSPETIVRGVDYLVKGKMVSEEKGIKVYEVVDYIERKEEERIKEYLGTDRLLLHANHTAMTPRNFMKMYQQNRPDWYQPLMNFVNGAELIGEYAKMPKGPIEEATVPLYRSGKALVVELPFRWIDFGTWESLINYQLKIENYELNGLEIEAKNNYVKSDKFTALIGVENLVVIETDDALLVMPKSQSGRVGEVVDKLKAEGRVELL